MFSASLAAEARCRRDGGPLDSVETLDGRVIYTGSPYGALQVAKDMVYNPGTVKVQLRRTNGRILDEAAIRAARY